MRLAWLREGDSGRAFVVMPLCQRSTATTVPNEVSGDETKLQEER